MKPQFFSVTAAIILLTSVTSYAGDGYFNLLGRNCGYGISDGYHAGRYCLTECMPCNSCSSVQQPMMQQPMMAPGYSQWAPHQFQQAGYPVGYSITPPYQPQYQSYAPGYGQPVTPAVAIPNPRSASHW